MGAVTTNRPELKAVEVKPEPQRVFPTSTRHKEILKGAIIDPSTTIPEPETLLSLNDTPILWRGCKAFICAVAKARKTTALTLFASILMGRDESANGFQAREGCRVLFIDTEQARYDTQRIAERIARLCGTTREGLQHRLQVLSLNNFSPDDIKGVMETAVIEFRPDILILDNWTDCVKSVLDEVDCTRFAHDLRALVELYNIAVFSVVHANEGTGENPKFRGWAIEEARKSDLTLYLQNMSEAKNEAERGDYSRARFGNCRRKCPSEFAISINDEGLPCIYHHEPGVISSKFTSIVEAMPRGGMEWGPLKQLIITKAGKKPRTAEKWISDMLSLGSIKKTGVLYIPTNPLETLPF